MTVPAPELSSSSVCTLNYSTTIVKNGLALTAGTDYGDLNTDILYGNEFDIAGAPWRTLAMFTDRRFFKTDGKYTVYVTVTLQGNPNPPDHELLYTATIYALPACSCRFKIMDQ